MLLDTMDRWRVCGDGTAWQVGFEFLAGLDGTVRDGRYALLGDDIYAVIQSYDTRPASEALPEVHRDYIDIQTLLAGRERIDWWPADGLTVRTPYDPRRDILFFDRPAEAGATLDLVPGRFTVFFPPDAHMPGLQAGPATAPVRKVVIKLRASLVAP